MSDWSAICWLKQEDKPHQGLIETADILHKTFLKAYVNFDSNLKFALKGPITNELLSVQVMAWRWTSNKRQPEAMMTSSLANASPSLRLTGYSPETVGYAKGKVLDISNHMRQCDRIVILVKLTCSYVSSTAAHIYVHYSDALMNAMASQVTGVSIVCSAVYSGSDQREHQSSASLAFVMGIHRWQVDSHHKGSVTRKMFPSDDVIINYSKLL